MPAKRKAAYLDAWQSVDAGEGAPLAIRVFDKDDMKRIIEELNEVLVT